MYPVIRLPFLVVICLVWILTGNGANRANEFVEQAMPQATPEMTATSGEVSAKQATQETGDPSPDMTGETWIAKGIPPKRNPKVTWYQSLSVEKMWNELSALENRNGALVTLKRAELNRGYFNGIVLISEKEIQEFRGQLLKISGVLQGEESSKDSQMPIMPDGQRYPAIILHIQSIDALAKIVRLPFIESVEPEFVAASGVGCSLSTYTPNPADGMLFDNRVPWSFKHMGVVDAWNLYKVNNAFYSPGYPIRIGVVDTGVYQDEQQLTTFFESSGFRSPAHNLTVVPQAWDDCGHGTRIAGLATAPADTQNIYARKIVGVAWGANLTTVKYNDSVIAWAGSRFALVNAIYLAVGDGSQIVNLALAMPYWSTFVYDNIDTVYRTTQTIFVAAAGTFVSSVQFPAAMPQVLAVAIVKSKDTSNPQAGYELYGGPFPESAYGEEVDLAAVNGDGDIPTTGGGQLVTSIGGSSSGTAHLSGIIALVWGKQPGATRNQVVARLRKSGSLRLISGEENLTPGNSSNVGYGIPDAYIAAGGSRHASIYGPSTVRPGASYTLSVSTDGWLPLQYVWNTGQNTASVTFTAAQAGQIDHKVTITNPIDGKILTAQQTVTIGQSHKRILYSDPAIVRYPPYPFAGGIYDVKVNFGVKMPVGCAVLGALGQNLDIVNGNYQNSGPPLAYLSIAWVHGFNISRPGGIGSRDLDVDARVWHSGINAIRIKIHYVISEPDGVDCNTPGATVHGWYPP